jgi:phosphatidyl-myo-inositol alpha-mannosyltransferase
MKIGFLLDDGLDRNDGVQQYVRTLGNWLILQNHEVHYLVGQTKRTDIPNVHSLARNIGVRFNNNRLAVPIFTSTDEIEKNLRTYSYDILHVQMPYSPVFAGKVLKIAPKKTGIVGTFHILPYGKLQKTGAQLLAAASRGSLRRIDSVVAVSSAAQQFAEQKLNIACTVIPNAVNLDIFNSGVPFTKYSNKQTVVFLGRLVERKGCIELVRAIHELIKQKKFENKELILCGSGPLHKVISRYIAKNKLEDYIKMVGQISEKDKPRYLASADVAVFPSLGGESFGIVLVEAIASGSGVVMGGDNPGYRYVLGEDSKVIVTPANLHEFAHKIDYLLTHPDEAKSIHKNQKQRIQQFDIHIVGPQILSEYKRSIAKRRN